MSLQPLIIKKSAPPSIKIRSNEPIHNVIEFTNINDFDEHYANNKEILDRTSTIQLNKMFKITHLDGDDKPIKYKISKDKGIIVLKRDSPSTSLQVMKTLSEQQAETQVMKQDIIEIKKQLSKIMEILQEIHE